MTQAQNLPAVLLKAPEWSPCQPGCGPATTTWMQQMIAACPARYQFLSPPALPLGLCTGKITHINTRAI